MIIHDFATTISCERCSDEITIPRNLSNKRMRELSKKHGWKVIAGKDVCPKCNMKDESERKMNDGN